jgi:hypothetical protein
MATLRIRAAAICYSASVSGSLAAIVSRCKELQIKERGWGGMAYGDKNASLV